MIRVLLCCGGGFSSSYVAERMKKEIIAKNLSDQLEMEFSPFSLVLLEIYQQTHMNPVHFPGEENVLKITRQKAYKHVYQK